MDETFSLARQEEVGRPVLLAGSGSGLSKQAEARRVQGQEVTGHAEKAEGSKSGNPKKKGESNAKNKGGDGRGRKRGRTYSLRDTIRDIEGRNRPSGRSAKELGITWLDTRCEESPRSKAHFLVGKTVVDGGTVFECKFCHRVRWLPNNLNECQRLGNWFYIYGLDGGYQRVLDLHPAAKRLMSKIQDIYYLKKTIPPDMFPLAVAAVMLDRDYPHDVEIMEEEVL